MNIEYFKKDIDCSNTGLVILFAGWSCDASQFRDLKFEGFDLCVVYDYRSLEFPNIDTSSYDKTVVMAWSFGVWVASYIMGKGLLPQSAFKIALNGTMSPIDDDYGIPSKLFNLTLRSIRGGGVDKFNRRVYGSLYGSTPLSSRDINSQVEELELLSDHFRSIDVDTAPLWDVAIIGVKDIIFPVDNMVCFWNKNSTFTVLLEDTPHYPFTEECLFELNRLM